MCGVRRRHFLLLLLACRTQPDQVLRALQLLVLGIEFRQIGEILRFCFREFAAEDDRQWLTAPHVIAKHNRDLPDYAIGDWRHVYLAIFVGLYDPGDAKRGFRRAVHHAGRTNLRLLEIVHPKIDLRVSHDGGRISRLSRGNVRV
jgi:hypothetical protein